MPFFLLGAINSFVDGLALIQVVPPKIDGTSNDNVLLTNPENRPFLWHF